MTGHPAGSVLGQELVAEHPAGSATCRSTVICRRGDLRQERVKSAATTHWPRV